MKRFKRNGTAKHRFFLAFALGLAFLVLSGVTWAQSTAPLKLRGFDTLEMGLDGKTLVARGNVEITYGDLWLRGDEVKLDVTKGQVVATGNVQVKSDGQALSGQEFVYNFNEEEGSLKKARGAVAGEGIKGKVYLSGDAISFSSDVIHVESGKLTTCDLDNPHYHLAASEMTVYINDRVVIRGVTYREGSIPLFYWPYLVIPIREGNTFELPKVGYSQSTGWFIKNSYAYYLSLGKGHLYLDYLQRQGWGYGLEHFYMDNDAGTGSVYLYRLHNRETGSVDLEASWKQSLNLAGTWAVGWEAGYQTYLYSGEPVQSLTGSVSLSEDGEREDLTLKLNHKRVTGGQQSLEQSGNLSYRRDMKPWELRLKSDWKREDEGLGVVEELSYLGEISRAEKSYKLVLRAEQLLNPSLAEGETAMWRRVNRLPEFTVETRAFRPFGLSTSLEAAVGRYHEYPAGFSAWRAQITGKLLNRAFPVTDNLRLNFSGTALASLYGTGDWRLVAKGAATAAYKLRAASFSLTYKDTEVFGITPFYFDRETPAETVTGQMAWTGEEAAIAAQTTYNFYTGLWDDLVTRVHTKPVDWLDANVKVSYDWYDAAVESVSGIVELKKNPYGKVRVGAIYDVSDGQLDRIDGEISLSFRDWEVAYKGAYDGVKREYLLGDVVLTRDLHCRQISLRYNQPKGEVWLEYSLKAFPATKIKVGSENESVLFDAEGFDDLLSLLKGD